jgi:methionine aminotransferase
MIIINTPHNPTGSVLSAQDMNKLDKLTRNNDIIVLSDEVYEHIVFDGYEHQSAARFPSLAERSIIVGSFGKTFHATGWKTGYILAPENITTEIRKVHQYNVFAVNFPVQLALAEYLKNPDSYLEVSDMYRKKRDTFNEALKGSNFIVRPSAGTYFQLLDYSKISDEKDIDFAKRLTTDYKLASIPVSVFYHAPQQHSVLRFCFAKQEETLLKAAEILHRL